MLSIPLACYGFDQMNRVFKGQRRPISPTLPRQSSYSLTGTDSFLLSPMIVPASLTNLFLKMWAPIWKLSISVSEVPGRHREMGTALDHGAGQSANATHSWSIYHGPLVWSCFAGSTSPPFIHPAVLRVFDYTNVQGTLLSSLGSSSSNSLRLYGQVMTTDHAGRAGLMALIRLGILGNATLWLIDLFFVQYQSWDQAHVVTLFSGLMKILQPTKLLSLQMTKQLKPSRQL